MYRNKVRSDFIKIHGNQFRVWSKGSGDRIGFFPGIGGLPKWTKFLDLLAEQYEVVAPSLPGFPGGGDNHLQLDGIFDWLLVINDIINEVGLEQANFIASSVSAPLLTDWAATWSANGKLVLIGPFGTFLDEEPIRDIWAIRPNELSRTVMKNPKIFEDYVEAGAVEDPIEWKVQQMRALEASARYLFPFGDTGLKYRLKRISTEVLIIRGEEDLVLPESHVSIYKNRIPKGVLYETVRDAGHLCELEQPQSVFQIVENFFGTTR